MSTFLYFRTYWSTSSETGWSGRNVLATSKLQLVETCIRSLELETVDVRTCACVDNSTPAYTRYLESKFDRVIHTSEGRDVDDHRGKLPVFGGLGSMPKLLAHIEAQQHRPDDVVLIVEDDYLFLAGGLKQWIAACGVLDGFVSPFDHPDRYVRNDDLFWRRADITIAAGRHWRTIEANTGVVGARYQYFRKTSALRKLPRLHVWFFWPSRLLGRELPSIDRVFYRRAYFWLRVKLYSPIPGLAAHVSRFIAPPSGRYLKKGASLPATQLSPGVDWVARFESLQDAVESR